MSMDLGGDSSEGIFDINITPFVDVALVLLVIFMVTAPIMVREELKVQLPKSLSVDSGSKAQTIGVAITKEGQVLLGGQLVANEDLGPRFAELATNQPEASVLISADAESKHLDLVRVIDLLKRQGLNRYALQVERIKAP